MFSIAADLTSSVLPSPPAQHWSCRQAARPSAGPTIPSTRHPEYWSSQPGPYNFGGLRTPPTDDMSTACHQPPLGHYDGRPMSAFPSTVLSQAERAKAVPDTLLHSQQGRYYPQYQPQADSQSRPVVGHPARNPEPRNHLAVPLPLPGQTSQPHQIRLSNGQSSRSSTPGSAGIYSQRKAGEGLSSSLTGQSSEIPEFISARGGSLPDLVAQVGLYSFAQSLL